MKYGLWGCGTFLNVKSICIHDDTFKWMIKVKCHSCDEVTPDYLQFTAQVAAIQRDLYECLRTDKCPIPNSRGTANLVFKCPCCLKRITISVVPESLRICRGDKAYFQKMAVLECRGGEPVAFNHCSGIWNIESNLSPQEFYVDLNEKEWNDIDSKTLGPLSVSDLEWHFSMARE